MAGALPSGGDPSQFDLGTFGMVGAGLTSLLNLTQGNALDALRGQVQGSSGWGGASGTLFDALDPLLSFPVALLKAITENLFGTSFPGITDMESALGALANFIGMILSAIGSAIETLAGGLIQQIIDAIVGGITGIGSTGNDPAAIVFALIGQSLAIPTQIFDQLWASIAQLLSGQQALQNAPGAVLTDDFASIGVGGYTNITGTLAVSGAGPYVQTPHIAVAYRNTGPATNQHGAQIVIDANQQGWCGVGICSDSAATSYAMLQVYSGFQGDAVRLLTGSSPTVAVVQRQTDFITTRLANTNVFDIWYETATNTFHVLRNAQKVFDWVDSTNIVTHDASHRRVLLVSNGEDDNENGSYGPGIRKVTNYDRM